MATRPEPVSVALYTLAYISMVPAGWDIASPGCGILCATTVILAILLSTAFKFVTPLISKKINEDQEKISPLECGFDPKILHSVTVFPNCSNLYNP
jgi:hypothetical protein